MNVFALQSAVKPLTSSSFFIDIHQPRPWAVVLWVPPLTLGYFSPQILGQHLFFPFFLSRLVFFLFHIVHKWRRGLLTEKEVDILPVGIFFATAHPGLQQQKGQTWQKVKILEAMYLWWASWCTHRQDSLSSESLNLFSEDGISSCSVLSSFHSLCANCNIYSSLKSGKIFRVMAQINVCLLAKYSNPCLKTLQ